MGQKLYATGVLVILLAAGFTGFSTPATQAERSPGDVAAGPGGYWEYTFAPNSLPGLSPAAPVWQQVNSSGFGDPETDEVTALETFNGYLYAGTHNPVAPGPIPIFDGAQIYRSQDGVAWTPVSQPGFNDPHDSAAPAILDLAVFNGRIYAGTGRGDGPGQIWRALDGVNWAPMVAAGFGDPDTVDISSLIEYNGWLYAGATNLISGAQIWRSSSGDNNTWTQTPKVPGTAGSSVTGFVVFNGALYAAVESNGPAQIWRSDGSAWKTIMSDGFGDSHTNSTGGMAEFAGYLYVGAGNTVEGTQLWRTRDGARWEQVIDPGFGDPNNQKVEIVFVSRDHLYVGVKNVQTGMELWRSVDGMTWEQANQDGFGDKNNSSSNGSQAAAGFLGDLYVGTSNTVDGGELWQLQQQRVFHFLPFILRWP